MELLWFLLGLWAGAGLGVLALALVTGRKKR